MCTKPRVNFHVKTAQLEWSVVCVWTEFQDSVNDPSTFVFHN